MGNLLNHTPVSPLGSERTDMQLIEDCLAPFPPPPCVVVPAERRSIDDLAWPVGVLRLEARRRVRHQLLAIYAISIEGSCPRVGGDVLVPAIRALFQGNRLILENQVDIPGRGSP